MCVKYKYKCKLNINFPSIFAGLFSEDTRCISNDNFSNETDINVKSIKRYLGLTKNRRAFAGIFLDVGREITKFNKRYLKRDDFKKRVKKNEILTKIKKDILAKQK